MICRPSDKDFKLIIDAGMLKNNPVQIEDVNNAKDIFGPEIGCLKGKTTKTKAVAVRRNIVAVPK